MKWVGFVLVGAGLLAAACSDGGPKSANTPAASASATASPTAARTAEVTPTATRTAVLSPTPRPPDGHPVGTRTGRADIDPVLAALEVGTPDALRGIVRYVSAPCVAVRPQGIGPVAVCPPGRPEGTPIDVFPSAPGEGTYIDRADFERDPRLPGQGRLVYAVIRQTRSTTEPSWPQGDYVVYFAHRGDGQPLIYRPQVYVEDGKVVLACWICFEQLEAPGVMFILPPPK